MTNREFCKLIYDAAKKIGEIDPLFVTAQAALESGYGKNAIGVYNIFGITKGSWKGDTELILTTEYFKDKNKKFVSPEKILSVKLISNGRYMYKVYRLFRKYNSYEECLQDHLSILKKPMYADAWPYRKDAKEFIRRISDNVGAKYATDINYISIMNKMLLTVEKYIK